MMLELCLNYYFSLYPDEPLGAVRNVSVTVLPGVDWVRVTWLPQSRPRHVSRYIVEYGLLQRIGSFFIRRKLKEKTRIIVTEVRC